MSTAIEWTDETWNPVVGCDKVSPGCDHCYAIGVAHRAMQPAHEGLTIKRAGERPDWSGVVKCLPERLDIPLRWRKPRRVFVNSMSDLFHPAVPDAFISDVFDVMACHGPIAQHTFQVLTKRPQRMAQLLGDWAENEGYVGAPNVWLGTSIESDRYTFRADHLRQTPSAIRFLSLEPLLGPLPSLDLTDIDWVIVGGESGPGARPMHPEWVRDIRDCCADAGVPFFFKQWGDWQPYTGREPRVKEMVSIWQWEKGTKWPDSVDGALSHMQRVGKKRAGRLFPSHPLDGGRTYDEMPKAVSA